MKGKKLRTIDDRELIFTRDLQRQIELKRMTEILVSWSYLIFFRPGSYLPSHPLEPVSACPPGQIHTQMVGCNKRNSEPNNLDGSSLMLCLDSNLLG